MSVDPAVHWILRLALAGLLATAAWHKLRAPARFRAALSGYRLLPARLEGVAAWGLVGLEGTLAVALLAPLAARAAALGAAGLFVLYALAIAVNLARGRRDIDCGCAGFGRRQTLSAGLVVRNALLVVAAGAAALPVAARTWAAPDALTVAAGTLVAWLLYAALDALLATGPGLAGPRRREWSTR